jgi:hypothetical protein
MDILDFSRKTKKVQNLCFGYFGLLVFLCSRTSWSTGSYQTIFIHACLSALASAAGYLPRIELCHQ